MVRWHRYQNLFHTSIPTASDDSIQTSCWRTNRHLSTYTAIANILLFFVWLNDNNVWMSCQFIYLFVYFYSFIVSLFVFPLMFWFYLPLPRHLDDDVHMCVVIFWHSTIIENWKRAFVELSVGGENWLKETVLKAMFAKTQEAIHIQ